MSLYRQAGRRNPRLLIAALAVGVAIGALAGYGLGRGSVESPSAAEAIAGARAELRPVAAGLELVPIEYEGALRGGKVDSPTEYQAAKDAVARAEEALAAAGEDMRAIDAPRYARARDAVSRLGEAIGAAAPARRIEALAEVAQEEVAALAEA